MKSKRSARAVKSPQDDEQLIMAALCCLESKMKYQSNISFVGSEQVKAYYQLQIACEKSEVFSVLFMNNKHQLIAFEKMFHGTVNEAVVYPRCVVQKALELNASAVIVGHNHPSHMVMPSQADINLTKELKKILDIVNVRLLDHIIVSPSETYSFSENQLL